MVRQLSGRHTITIPKKALEKARVKPGDVFEVTSDGYRIILTPKTVEDRFTDEEWEKLRRLAKAPGTQPMSAEAAKRYLHRLTR